nr:ribonuclease H-like domain-containing protein [Tanacetum cinerariifolium]
EGKHGCHHYSGGSHRFTVWKVAMFPSTHSSQPDNGKMRGFRQGMKKGDRVVLGGENILVVAERTTIDQKTDRAADLLLWKDKKIPAILENPLLEIVLALRIEINQEIRNSFKPVAQTTINDAGTSTTLIPGPVTTEEKAQKKNDVKARSMLLMELPNEHLMTFNQYKDAKTLFAAIQTRFGGNEAIKKTQKTLLKKMYENFSALSTESLNSIFIRLQKILRHTNEVNTAYGVSTAKSQANPTSSQVNTTSTQVSTAYLSDATVYAFLASQPNGSQLVHEDLVQIHKDDLEEIDLKWQLALLSMRTRMFFQKMVERSLSMGVTQLDMTNPRNRNQDSSRRTVDVEETASMQWWLLMELVLTRALWQMMIKGVGFVSYNAVPPPPTRLFSPPKLNLSNSSLEDFQQPEFKGYGPKTSNSVSEDISNEVKKSLDASLVKELVSDDKIEKKTVSLTVAKIEFSRPKQ